MMYLGPSPAGRYSFGRVFRKPAG